MRQRPSILLVCLFLLASSLLAGEMEILRSRILRAKPQSIRAVSQPGQRLPLRLFDNIQLEATLDAIDDDPLNGFVWRGHLADVPGSWVVLVEDDGCMAGTIAGPDSFYRIRCLGDGTHAIDEVNVLEPTLDDVEVPSWFDEASFQSSQASSSDLEDDEIVDMDLMVLYTRKASKKLVREIETGQPNARKAIKSQIRLAVAVTNTALENSGVNIRIRLVKMRPVKYKASGSSGLDLYYVSATEDGKMDQIHGWRDKYGADFVSLVLEDMESGVGGRGYQVPPEYTDTPGLMFNVIRYDLLWWVALAHELGHNMGLAHDKKNDSSIPASRAYTFSRGYRDPQGGFRTIMSYKKGCNNCRWMLPHYSNKDIRWEGAPTGSDFFQPSCGNGSTTGPKCGRRTGTNKENCARSLNLSRAYYAGVRDCRVSCGN